MLLNNLKHYKDIVWLLYKYSNLDLSNFDSQLDLQGIIKERGAEKGKPEEFAKDLESLGPIYIKLGQILSSESQLLPPEYEEALQQLQDKAAPMSYKDVESVIVDELGSKPGKIFAKFEKEPLSAASLGQVHLAELEDGKKVAVKVQRKDIQNEILEQLEVLTNIAKFLEENTEYGKKYHVTEKIESLKNTLLKELDYTKEANNLKILSENLKEFDRLVVPLPLDKYTTLRVLTMDYLKAEKITELSPIKKMNADGPQLARDLLKAFLKQIMMDGFFQMDPHPGNVYLTHKDKKPCLALFDMGMVAHVPFELQGKVITCLFAMSEGREGEVADILISIGTKLPNFDKYLFHSKINEIIGSYHGLTINQTPMGKILLKLFHAAAESDLWLPIQFSMIGKTLMSLSSVLIALDPEMNPNTILKDEASKLMSSRLSKQFSSRVLYGSLTEGINFLEHLPSRLNQVIDLLLNNDFQFKIKFHENESITKGFQKIANRITLGLILASLVIAAALLMRYETSYRLFGYPGFAMIMFLLAAGGSFILIFSIILNDKNNK